MERMNPAERAQDTKANWGSVNAQYHDETMPDYVVERTNTPEEIKRAEEAANNEAADAIFRAQTESAYHVPKRAPQPYTPVATPVANTPERLEGTTFLDPAPKRERPAPETSRFARFLKLITGE